MASIQNRNGHYLVTICSGYDVYGKKIRNTRTFTPNPSRTKRQQEDDLKRFVRAFEEEIESGVSQDGRKITFKAFSERWLTEYTLPTFSLEQSPNTRRNWRAKSTLLSATVSCLT